MTNDDREGEIPAGPLGEEPGADAWVDHWISLFGDDTPASPAEDPPATSPVESSTRGPLLSEGTSVPTELEPESGASAEERPPPDDHRAPLDDDVATIEAWQRAQERSRRQARVRANQRAARQMRRLAPERNTLHATLAPASVASNQYPSDPVRPLGWVAGGLVVAILALIGYLFITPGSDPIERQANEVVANQPASPDALPDLDLPVGASVAPASIEQLALSTVQVVGLDDAGQAQCAGSGIIVATDGTILTNAHVVRSDVECQFSSLAVGVTVDSSSPPELLYRAEVVLLRLGVDLAVLRVVGPLRDDAGIEWPRMFPAAPIGDSDTVQLGDSIRILGYPAIGGDTITLTTGSVSGFTSQVGLGSQALIKTDATISAGNSGGLAVDAEGRVIGIPTKARASERGPAVDCRPVTDTNGDDLIGEGDACVPVGGFLNGVRPINLSLPLLAAAGVSAPAIGPQPEPEPLDLTGVEFFNPRFSLGVTDDQLPDNEIVTAVAGLPRLCFFVDWEGIPPGALWDAAWYVDNEIQVGRATYTGRIWDENESGLYFSLCIEADDGDVGLPAGVYEIALYLDRRVVFVEGIELTNQPVAVVETKWENDTGLELCGLAINPAAISRQVGLNQLPTGTIIPVDGDWTTELPVGSYVVEASDCDGEPVANRLNAALQISASGTFSILP